jgi:hypothetical protein
LFDISKLVRTELGRCKDPNHRAAAFKYDLGIAGSDLETWKFEHLTRTSAASGQNVTFSVLDSTTDLPELHFQLLSEGSESFELFLSMAKRQEMREHRERMQHMWELAARIAVAIYDQSVKTLTGLDPDFIKAYLEAVTQSLQQFSDPTSRVYKTKPSSDSRLRETLRRRCITIPSPARLLFERKRLGRLSCYDVDAFYAEAGDARFACG